MIRATVELVVRDKDGVIIKRLKQPARSFLANYARVFTGLFSAKGGASLTAAGVVASAGVLDQTGASTTVWTEWYETSHNYYGGGTPMACNAGDDDDSFGIIVGKGTTPVSYDDYKLASKIAHGTGVGQLDYDSHSFIVSVDTTAGTATLKFSRSFKNLSGDTITVAEVGIKARSYWKQSANVDQDIKYLIARDVLAEPVSVPYQASLNVIYTLEVSL